MQIDTVYGVHLSRLFSLVSCLRALTLHFVATRHGRYNTHQLRIVVVVAIKALERPW